MPSVALDTSMISTCSLIFLNALVPVPQNMYGQPLPYGGMAVPPPPPGMHYSYPHHQPMQPGLEHMLPGALPGPVVYPGYPHVQSGGGPMVMAQHMGQVRRGAGELSLRVILHASLPSGLAVMRVPPGCEACCCYQRVASLWVA